jgi:transcriptional regulator with XRE-family HTH domain
MLYVTLRYEMDKKIIVCRIEELMREKGISNYESKENSDISTTIYQWKKNATRDKTRVPSLRSIEKICDYLDVSLSYFFSFNKYEQRTIKNNEIYEAIENLNEEQIKIIELLIKQFK